MLVSELPGGETLSQLQGSDLGPRLGFDPSRALSISEQIAGALETMHERALVHGNIRPESVSLAPDGHVTLHGFSYTPLPSGASPERVAYLSPEQVRGEVVGLSTDLWAFGVSLYEMLAGVRPFLGTEVADTSAAIVGMEPEWSALPLDTPRIARQLLKSCLEKDSTRRASDVGEIRREFAPYRAGHLVDPGLHRVSSGRRRNSSTSSRLNMAMIS